MFNRHTLIISFFVIIGLFGAQKLGWLRIPAQGLRVVINPLAGGIYRATLAARNGVGIIAAWRDSAQKIQTCEEKLKKDSVDGAAAQTLKDENDLLKKELGFVKIFPHYAVASAIGKSDDASQSVLIIDKGEASGISVGKPVIVGSGNLLGKIIKTEKNISWVRLITDNESRFAATAVNNAHPLGVAMGRHGISVQLSLVPQSEALQVGDIVITSGIETISVQSLAGKPAPIAFVPRGLIIGKIDSIQKNLYEPFQSAAVSPLVDLNKISVVIVLTD